MKMSGKYCEVPDKQQQTPHTTQTSELIETSRAKLKAEQNVFLHLRQCQSASH